MAPPRRILRQQLEILMDFLEENKDMSKGLPPGTPVSHHATRQKWAALAKKLNAVQSGTLKTPDGWKKYWFEWRHKCRRKAADARRFQSTSEGGTNRFVPLNDLEVRVLELSGKGSVTSSKPNTKQIEDFIAENSDSEQQMIDNTLVEPIARVKRSVSATKVNADDTFPDESPPKWALELEERRISAEERIAEALQSISNVMLVQEERRKLLENRMADALTAIAGTLQDLNSGLQDTLQRLIPSEPSLKNDVFYR
ncbi:hypothetical protein RR48_02637 [Papilio machaon]|uniref:Regulatory protein zeste n=1 Tax=Papilio machaon TaxID=76193 RepID=A0A0N1PIY8_PAPMA|nr:hypothetical protein RR48_02637 [Papilio machaon]